jgi:lipoprotein-anchoring transpeptidase ErfK/SrfK
LSRVDLVFFFTKPKNTNPGRRAFAILLLRTKKRFAPCDVWPWNFHVTDGFVGLKIGNSARELIMSASRKRFCSAILFASILTFPAAQASAQSMGTLAYSSAEPDSAVFPQYAPPQPGASASGDELPAPLRRQIVAYDGSEPAGTIIIDTAHTFLYLTLGNGKAMRYGIGVGREGFTWSGVQQITRKAEWPDWIPPAEMVARQPYLPRWVGGGPGNPLGARALYLGNTDYRIHGTNDPSTIGKQVSSGCIRLRNEDVEDLYQRVGIGTTVVVLPGDRRNVSAVAGGGTQQMALAPSVRPIAAAQTSVARASHSNLMGVY